MDKGGGLWLVLLVNNTDGASPNYPLTPCLTIHSGTCVRGEGGEGVPEVIMATARSPQSRRLQRRLRTYQIKREFQGISVFTLCSRNNNAKEWFNYHKSIVLISLSLETDGVNL